MENDNDVNPDMDRTINFNPDSAAKKKKMLLIIAGTLMVVGLILILAPKKKEKPKPAMPKPIAKPKVKKITTTITPKETIVTEEDEIEDDEIIIPAGEEI